MKVNLKEIRKIRVYSEEFKKEIVNFYESGKYSVLQMEKLYGVNDVIIYKWIYKFSTFNEKGVRVVEMKDSNIDMKLENPFSDCELAWTSYNKVTTKITLRQQGFISDSKDGKRIHPTQKPSELYKRILDKHAKQGDKILDTHLGSGSIAIACHDYGFDLTACELDKEYLAKTMERINNHVAQQKLF